MGEGVSDRTKHTRENDGGELYKANIATANRNCCGDNLNYANNNVNILLPFRLPPPPKSFV